MPRDDDDQPRPTPAHQLGQDLSLLSVGECEARIETLKGEIARIKAAMAKKQASRDAANKFFK